MSKGRIYKLEFLEKLATKPARTAALEGLEKIAAGDQHGIFQHFQSNVADYATRDRYLAQRGGDVVSRDRDGLYGVGPEHEDSYVPTEHVATHLSTRYSPDRVGVQAMRVSDGVFQDPYTNKVYDYNEGFKTEDGRDFPPGHAALQTSIMNLASHLDKKGLIKEATYLDVLLRKNAVTMTLMGAHPDAFDTGELMALMQLKMDEMGMPPDSVPNNEVHDWSKRCAHKDNPCNDEIVGEFLRKQEAGEAMHFEPGMDEGAEAAAGSRDERPLTTAEIAALFKAHEDVSSDYKLSPDRLAQMTNGNLTEEEAAIVDGAAGVSSFASHTVKNLVKLATHLDRKGFHKEATYIDVLLRKNI